MRRPAVLALPVAAVLLAGCGSDGADQRRADARALIEAANDGDADAVREHADALVATVEAQDLPAGQADRLRALARSIRTNADVIDEELLERRRLEAERAALQKQLEEERRKAEEAARQAAEQRREGERDNDEGKGEDKDD